MTFGDIMALAKNGYKPADIKELLAIQTDPEQPEQIEQTEQPEQPEQPEQTEQPEQQEQPEPSEKEQALTKKIEELQKQLSDTQSKLKTAQRANTQANVKTEGGQSDTERLNDWARSFM